ncbi:MAG: hypothetical protein ABI557_03300, partial [Aureliella sp.]
MSAPHFSLCLPRRLVSVCAAVLSWGLAIAPTAAQSTSAQQAVAPANEANSKIADIETRNAV